MAECEDQVGEWECGYFSKQSHEHEILSQRRKKNNNILANNYKLKQIFSSSPSPTVLHFFPLSYRFLVRGGTFSDAELSFFLLVSKLLQGCAMLPEEPWREDVLELSSPCLMVSALCSCPCGAMAMLVGSPWSLSAIGRPHTFPDVLSVSKVSLPFWQKTLFSIRKKKNCLLWMVCTHKIEKQTTFSPSKLRGNKCQVQFLVCQIITLTPAIY